MLTFRHLLSLLKWHLAEKIGTGSHFDKGNRCCRNVNNKIEKVWSRFNYINNKLVYWPHITQPQNVLNISRKGIYSVMCTVHHKTQQQQQQQCFFPGQPGWASTRKRFATSGFLMSLVGSQNSASVASHCMTASWLATTTQMTARESNVPLQDFALDTVPAGTITIYLGLGLALCMLHCIIWDLVHKSQLIKITSGNWDLEIDMYAISSCRMLLTRDKPTPCRLILTSFSTRSSSPAYTQYHCTATTATASQWLILKLNNHIKSSACCTNR